MKTPGDLLQALGIAETLGAKRPLAVCLDFDGTVTTRDAVLATLDRYGAPEWKLWEARWRRGEMSSRDCMRRQFETVRASLEEVVQTVTEIEIRPGFREFIAWCEKRDVPVIILSDGLDLCIRAILDGAGLSRLPVVANHGEIEGRRFRTSFPYHNEACTQCGTCKCSFVEALRARAEHLVYVGDGHSDRCASAKADTLFARDDLARMCKAKGYRYLPFTDFYGLRADIQDLLSRLEAHPHPPRP